MFAKILLNYLPSPPDLFPFIGNDTNLRTNGSRAFKKNKRQAIKQRRRKCHKKQR